MYNFRIYTHNLHAKSESYLPAYSSQSIQFFFFNCKMENAQLQDIAEDKRAMMEEAIRQLDSLDLAIQQLRIRLDRSRRRRQAPPSGSCGLSRGEVLWAGSSSMTVLLEQRLGVLVAIRAAYRRFVVRTYNELAELEVLLSYDVFYGYL